MTEQLSRISGRIVRADGSGRDQGEYSNREVSWKQRETSAKVWLDCSVAPINGSKLSN